MEWLSKIVRRIAEEVHKSKIDELEKRILEMEKDHKVLIKTISDNENKIAEFDVKIFNSTIVCAKMEATIETVLYLKDKEQNLIQIPNRSNDGNRHI